MTDASPASRHAALARAVRLHDHRYYVLDDPQISDREYDALYAELRALEAAHPELLTADSPTQRVGGAPRSDMKTVEHVVPMTSLDNTYGKDDLSEFLRRVIGGLPASAKPAFCVEPKLDGGSIEVRHEGSRSGTASRADFCRSRARRVVKIP